MRGAASARPSVFHLKCGQSKSEIASLRSVILPRACRGSFELLARRVKGGHPPPLHPADRRPGGGGGHGPVVASTPRHFALVSPPVLKLSTSTPFLPPEIAQFIAVTSASPSEAQNFIAQANGDVENAIQLFFAASDDPDDDPAPSNDEMSAPAVPVGAAIPSAAPHSTTGGGGNVLGSGRAEPLPVGWGQNSNSSVPRVGRIGQTSSSSSSARPSGGGGPRIATLGSLNSGAPSGGAHASHGHGDDDDDEDDDRAEEWYTGGERSGLSVENPDRAPGGRGIIRDILKKAAEAGPPPSQTAPDTSSGPSWGSGNTLGSDSTPSHSVPDPEARDEGENEEEEEVAVRHLTFWRDGFSIEDGELKRYDQPGNRELLNAINQGRAPPSLLDVRIGQPVEVRVAKRLDEDYKPAPPKPRGAWDGTGNRLGSPVPNIVSSATGLSSAAAASNPTISSSAGEEDVKFSVNMNEPTTAIQIRLGDGTRLIARVNLTHTIRDIRSFIDASRATSTRSYVLQMTFPNRDLTDEAQTVKDAKLENAVIVQRWV